MFQNVFRMHRAKCSRADMKRDKRVRNFVQDFLREMQTGCRRSDRAGCLREDRLITRVVLEIAGAANIRRQRHRAARVKIDVSTQQDNALAVRQNFFDAQNHIVDLRHRSDPHFSSRLNEAFPAPAPESFQKQELNGAVVGEPSRRQNARVVEHEHIAVTQRSFQFAKLSMFNPLRVTMQNHHARIVAAWKRPLRDQSVRQRIIVVAQP